MKKGLVFFLGFMVLAAAAIGPADAATGTMSGAGLKTGPAGKSYLAGLRMEGIRQSYLAGLRMKALRAGSPMPETDADAGVASAWLTRVDAGTVNMVTNRVDDAAVKSVQIDGRAYSVNSEIGGLTMTKNPSTRFSRDPLTNNKVDKSEAAIYADASGRVYYFESPSTHKEFLALAEGEGVYALRRLNNPPGPTFIVELAPQLLQKVRSFFIARRTRAQTN